MAFPDFELLAQADADAKPGLPGRWRTLRRLLQRSILNRDLRSQERYFCQNSGACGSHYIVDLLTENGLEKVYHEKAPDFNEIGVQHYEQALPKSRLIQDLRYTRHNTFFEANNRLFSLSGELADAFPGAAFIHLFRHPANAVRSAMSKPDVQDYLKTNLRFQGSLAGAHDAPPLSRFCFYWRNMNQRILDDLDSLQQRGKRVLWLRFEDMVDGNVSSLERFMNRDLSKKKRDPSHVGAIRRSGKFEPFDQWNEADRRQLEEICTPLYQTLSERSET